MKFKRLERIVYSAAALIKEVLDELLNAEENNLEEERDSKTDRVPPKHD